MKKEICNNCTFYSAYYRQFSSGYHRLGHGFCSKFNKPLTQFESCEIFKSNEQKEKLQSKRRLETLEQALTSINEIALILKEKECEK